MYVHRAKHVSVRDALPSSARGSCTQIENGISQKRRTGSHPGQEPPMGGARERVNHWIRKN